MGRREDTRCVTRRGALHFLVSIVEILKPNECRKSTRRVAISKRIVVRSIKSAQVQKKWNEVQKKRFPFIDPSKYIYIECMYTYIYM